MTGSSIHSDSGPTHRISFQCDLTEARKATRALRAFLAGHTLDESELFACELCLAEACNNAVQYAGDGVSREAIIAEALCTTGWVELRVTDHTAGFILTEGHLAVPPPDREHGRGLFIIQSMMDDVRYLRGVKDNTLIMRKKRAHQRHRPFASTPASAPDDLRRQLDDFKRTISAMARELCLRSESLAAIFRCGTELGHAGDLEGFTHRLLGDLLHLAAADWFVLRLIPPQGLQLTVFAASGPELHGEPIHLGASSPVVVSAELAAATTRSSVIYASKHARRSPDPLLSAGPKATGLVNPLLFGETLVGTLAVGRHNNGLPFSELQAEMLRTFSEFIAIQIVNLRYQEEQASSRIVARELEIARSIQRASFPRSLPQLGNFSLAGCWESARQVAGDFYDALPVGEHSLLLVVADVMGKGVPAAMFATITRALIRAISAHHCQPAELLERLNALLYEELSAVDMFITVQLALLDLRWRHVIAASAGHCPILLVSGSPLSVRTLSPTGAPLGILPDVVYEQQCATLDDPACLIVYTDGLTEARDPAGDMFGQERLAEWLRNNVSFPCSSDQLCGRLAAELNRFRAGAPLRDDQTFLILADKTIAVAPRPALSPVRVDHPAALPSSTTSASPS